MDAVTGRWSGAVVWEYQCRIRASAGREKLKSVYLDIKMSPGTFSAVNIVAYFCTIHKD